MKPILRKLTFAAAVLTASVTLAGIAPGVPALAQTSASPAAAPSAAASLPEAIVKALQEALNSQGIAVETDGVLGDGTRAAIRQYQSQHHLPVTGEADQATLDKLGVAGQPGEGQQAAAAPDGGDMGGQGMMMTPEMMQMMQRMMAKGGMHGMMGAQGGPQQGMGPGMMGQARGQMPMAGAMTCPMMQTMMGAPAGSGMPGMMGGPAMLYGMPHGAPEEMTPARVRTILEQRLAHHGNPRLKLGEIAAAADGSIVAEIVTVDGSLVQKLAFNRYPGLVRQIVE